MEYRLIEDHRQSRFRSGEGAAVELKDGRLLMLYTAFRSGSGADHAPAEIWARISADKGNTWGEATVIFRPTAEALNVMSPSLLRLADGRIGCTFSIKWTVTHCVPQWTASGDEGLTWSVPQPISREQEYFCVNNDRLVQLRDGSLVLPYALHRDVIAYGSDKELLKEWLNAWCGIFYSTDAGQTWLRPENARKFEKAWHSKPVPYQQEDMASVELKAIREKYDVFQEPGVVELKDGQLFMWVRSLCHIYFSRALNKEAAWEDFAPLPGFNVSCSPQTIKRLPLDGSLVMLYNDRGDVSFGSPTFQFRTPLSVAISRDEGRTWEKIRPLEADQSRNYCYYALLFFGSQFLTAYYESTDARNEDGTVILLPDGTPKRRNLASLKICLGAQAELLVPS